jgi:hypothetical protein
MVPRLQAAKCVNGTTCFAANEYCQFIRSTGESICCGSASGCCGVSSDCTLGYDYCCSSTCATHSCPSTSSEFSYIYIIIIILGVLFIAVLLYCIWSNRNEYSDESQPSVREQDGQQYQSANTQEVNLTLISPRTEVRRKKPPGERLIGDIESTEEEDNEKDKDVVVIPLAEVVKD